MLNRLYNLGYKIDIIKNQYTGDTISRISIEDSLVHVMHEIRNDIDAELTQHANELIDEYLSKIVYNTISIKYSLLEKSNKLYKDIINKYQLEFNRFLMFPLGLSVNWSYLLPDICSEFKELKLRLFREACL